MALEKLDEEICSCRKCRLWQGAKNAVPGEGPTDARVMIVGQNPGGDEDECGRPFVGRAGKFLNKVLAENGINRNELFVTNIVKHITPKNRKPSPEEIEACLPYLITQINTIKPKCIVLFGATARETPRQNGIEYLEVVHPSAAMRFTKMREKFNKQIAALSKRS